MPRGNVNGAPTVFRKEHGRLLIGVPGPGESMLAKRLGTILPPLALEEAPETTRIHSIVGRLAPGQALVTRWPSRAPHHTACDAGLLGGNVNPTPGEVAEAGGARAAFDYAASNGGPAARKSSGSRFRGNSDRWRPEAKASVWLTRDGERRGENGFPIILTFILTLRLECD